MSLVLELNLAWLKQSPEQKKMDAELVSIGTPAKLENINSKGKPSYNSLSLNTKKSLLPNF